MACLSGVVVSVIISLSAIPIVCFATTSAYSSDPLWLALFGFSVLSIIGLLCKLFLKPSDITENALLEKRGLLYYTCCVFMWASVADACLQSRLCELFGLQTNSQYFEFGEVYLKTPFGICTQWWNAVVHYIMYVIIIFQIDNHIDCRIVALYWSGSIVNSQLIVLGGSLSGIYSDQLEYSCWMNVIFIAFPLWVFYHFITKPKNDCSLVENNRIESWHKCRDALLCIGLLIATVFCCCRGLGACNSKISFIKYYVNEFEPYIKDPAQFSSAWVILIAVYGIPYQLAAIHGLLNRGCQWMLDLSVVYAAAVLQGTFVYLTYSWFPSSELQYRIPRDALFIVLSVNIFLIFLSHALMFRCLKDPTYFFIKLTSAPLKKKRQ